MRRSSRHFTSSYRFISDLLESRCLLAAVTWDGGGDGTSWSSVDNWSTNVLPTSADDVTIDLPAATNIVLAANATVNSLNVSRPFTLTGGILTATNGAAFNNTFDWSAGSLNGAITLGNSTIANLTGGGTKRFYDTMTNNGVINYSGTNFVFGTATLTNNGTFNAINSGHLTTLSGAGNEFVNAGTFNKSGASSVFFTDVTLINTGVFNQTAGEIQLQGGSTTTPIVVAMGATMIFTKNTFTINATGAAFSGGGDISLSDTNDTAKISLGASTATIANLNFTGGILESSAGNTLTLTGAFDWSHGDITGNVIFGGSAIVSLTGTGTKRVFDTVTNNGFVQYTGTRFELSSATFNNAANFNANSSGNIASSGGGGNAFNNIGSFNKTGTSTLRFTDVPLHNTGTFNVGDGPVILEGGSTTKTITVSTPASLTIAQGTFTINKTGSSLSGEIYLSDEDGSAAIELGVASTTISGLTMTKGTLNAGTGAMTLSFFDWSGGTISGAVTLKDTVNFTGTDTKRITDTMTNSGFITYSGTNFELSSATFINNFFTITMQGTGDIKSSDSLPSLFQNNGALNKNTSVPLTFTGITLVNNSIIGINTSSVTTSTPITGVGEIVVTANASLSAPSITQGPITVNGTATLTGSNLRSTVTSLTMSANGSIQIGNNGLAVNYTGQSPLATLQSKLISGRNNGTWNGTGIRSSAAAADNTTAIGFGESSQTGLNTFMGESIDNTAVLFRHTKNGDANLDHAVNFSDLLVVAQNYGQTNRIWTQGNFDFDATGNVDFGDLLIIAQRYGNSLPFQSRSDSESHAVLGV